MCCFSFVIFKEFFFLFCIQHENASIDMFDHMIEENDLLSSFHGANLKEPDLMFIKALIEGKVFVETS